MIDSRATVTKCALLIKYGYDITFTAYIDIDDVYYNAVTAL